MRWSVYSSDQCPNCGREDSSERVKRTRMIRLIWPETRLMKCRLCLSRFLVHNAKS